MTVMGQVERGQVSVGLVGRKADTPHLEFRFLARDRLVLVVPPGHALGRRKKVTVKELCRHPFVQREVGVQKELEARRLRAVAVTDLHCDRDMFVVQDRRRVLPLPARQFLTFLETNPVPDPAP
jgi:DNA-binding transcriptional LysR family regulator